MVISMKSQRNFTLINGKVDRHYLYLNKKAETGLKPDLHSLTIRYT
jgi:hypothetical protein